MESVQTVLLERILLLHHQIPPAPLFWLLLIAAAPHITYYILITAAVSPPPVVDCRNQTCGSVSGISYPFTLTTNNASCPSYHTSHSYFQLYCSETTQTLYMLPDPVYHYSSLSSLPVMAILEDSLIVNISNWKAVMKPSPDGNISNCNANYSDHNVLLPPVGSGPYIVSDDNDFGSFGCSTGFLFANNLIGSDNDSTYLYYRDHGSVSGCSVLLPDQEKNPRCGNETCCVDSLPPASDLPTRYSYIYVQYSDFLEYDRFPATQTDAICSCDNNYATIFHADYTDFAARSFGAKIKWALPSQHFNDTDLLTAVPDYACSSKATPVAVPDVEGYRCSCISGFAGDGYTNGTGCLNVNECDNPSLNRCVLGSTCVDNDGYYSCECDSKYRVGDGRSDGTGCRLSSSLIKAIISVSRALLILGVIIIFIALWMKRVKQRNFHLNGGLELQEFMKNAGHDITRIFTMEELKIATNNYDDSMKIGTGGFGAVYKGRLENGKLVAIKKSIKFENGENAQFSNEIFILTKINHKHIVRLLGCCLETKTPLLVYEFVPNGTLAENLERKDGTVMTWDQRLKVAVQTSQALAYLHRAASPPILHRDVKSANVLLDENWDVKVADFGVSRLVPDGIDHVSTAVQGTLGYLDPEYFQTLQLTDKSDVYSLGVMLVELITTLKPVDTHHREPKFSNLALLFIHHMKEDNVNEIIDPRIEMVDDRIHPNDVDWAWKVRSSIMSVASLAHRCLALMGHDRPSMVEVEHELHRISQILYTTNDTDNFEEGSSLLSYGAGAMTIENDEFIIQSHNSYSSASNGHSNVFQVSALGR